MSYKYADSNVAPIGWKYNCTSRDYVNELMTILRNNGHAYFGEDDKEDLSHLSDEQIYEKLKNRIFPTSCTIVLISPNMKESCVKERDQWIPWEVYYSLRETTRSDYTSRRNAVLAVVLPDNNGSYSYALEKKFCCASFCTKHHTDKLFTILGKNMFNKKVCQKEVCSQNDTLWHGDCSYIPMVRWDNFVGNVNYWIEKVESIKDNRSDYELHLDLCEWK